jgi:hypothetical protein
LYVLKKYTANGAMHIFTLPLSLSLSLIKNERICQLKCIAIWKKTSILSDTALFQYVCVAPLH